MKTKILLNLLAPVLVLTTSAAADRLNIVATLPTYGAIAEAVGGDHVTVTSLARGTEDPHFIDARPSFVRTLNQADALIDGGAGLETGWLPPLVQNARNAAILPGTPGRITVSAGIRMLGVPVGPLSRAQGDVHAAGNPHFELDPVNGVMIARTIAAALSRIDEGHAADYTRNLEAFAAEMQRRLAAWNRLAAPLRGRKAVAYHQTFEYLAARFGFTIVGYIEPKPGSSPSPSHIARLVPAMKQAAVALVLMEPNRPSRTPQYVADKLGVPLVKLPAMVGGDPAAKNYFELIDFNLHSLVNAVK